MDVYVLSYYVAPPPDVPRIILGVFRTRKRAQQFSAIHAGISRSELWEPESGEYSSWIDGHGEYRIEVYRLDDPLTFS